MTELKVAPRGGTFPELPTLQLTLDAHQRRLIASASQVIVLTIAGAAPVLSIPLFILGIVDIHQAALFFISPLAIITLILFLTRSVEATWALRGMIAGLLAVTAYDAMRMPFVLAKIWPDFIPRLGGWVTGLGGDEYLVGYLWRYPGDGGGMGMVFFLGCAIVGIRKGTLLGKYVIALGIGYGIFVWSGLIATVAFTDKGSTLLFPMSRTTLLLSLLGHLIYGFVLAYCYRRVIDRDRNDRQMPAGVAPEKSS